MFVGIIIRSVHNIPCACTRKKNPRPAEIDVRWFCLCDHRPLSSLFCILSLYYCCRTGPLLDPTDREDAIFRRCVYVCVVWSFPRYFCREKTVMFARPFRASFDTIYQVSIHRVYFPLRQCTAFILTVVVWSLFCHSLLPMAAPLSFLEGSYSHLLPFRKPSLITVPLPRHWQ